jgi:hypothetical protein
MARVEHSSLLPLDELVLVLSQGMLQLGLVISPAKLDSDCNGKLRGQVLPSAS